MAKQTPKLKAIVVVDQNWNIGYKGNLLVHLPGDLRYFKEKTMGKTLIVGRKTLESFPGGKPLPGRQTILLTQNTQTPWEDCIPCHSKEQALSLARGKETLVAGGEAIYRLFLEDCHTFYVTKIHRTFQGDRTFPNLDRQRDLAVTWQSPIQEESTTIPGQTEATKIQYQFLQYERIEQPTGTR